MPNLYALPKVHKPGDSMKPISSNIGASTYGLAKHLVRIFQQLKN